jgi:hypothetical protein
MPPHYDIYGLSKQRDRVTVEKFLNHFSFREKIENRVGQEIIVDKNEKYEIVEIIIPVSTLSEVINVGFENLNFGFSFYVSNNLKEKISCIVLKFTFDGKIIFGVSIEENRVNSDGSLTDNYDKAFEIEKMISELTNSIKTSIQFEHGPSDDEEELDRDIEVWRKMNGEKRGKVNSS